MNKETTSTLKKLMIYVLIYIAISSVIIYFNINKRYLIFNAGLSFIPYVVSGFTLSKKDSALFVLIGLFVSVIFYPNAIYMFTDFIHIKTSDYYKIIGGEVVYVMEAINWIKLGTEVCLITLSMVLSFETFVNILKLIRCHGHKIAELIMLVIASAGTSIAVYIGRFLRFNSWDILKIHTIISNILKDISTNDYYLLGAFAIIHFIIMLILYNMKQN
ncbi:DUF1361 domain-containing protein [Peptoniphilus asaccharolyticus]